MRVRILFILFLLGCFRNGFTQKIDLNHSVVEYIKKSTPQASQFQKYGDVPVNTNTGAVDISLPLFKIGIKNVDWKIGLNYHSGGIKVSELAGPAGLGWNLNAGGMISAKIYQRADVFTKSIADSSVYCRTLSVSPTYDPMVDNSCAYGSDISIAEYIDGQKANEDTKFQMNFIPDIFYLNAGNLTAKFFLKNDSGYSLPTKDISIRHIPSAYANNNSYPGSWIVIDEIGNRYTFEAKGGNATNYLAYVSAIDTSFGYPQTYYSYNPVFALTKVENSFGDKINFYYTTECYQYRLPDQDEYRIYSPVSGCYNSGNGFVSASHKEGSSEVCEARLDSISTTNGQLVVFKYSNRSDLIGASKLDTVSLFSRIATQTNFIKSYKLSNSYWGSGSDPRILRLRLDSLREFNSVDASNTVYKFTYNVDSLPSRISPAQDTSGYYNGQTSNTNLVPYYGGNRSYSLTHTKACALESIKYPTGGYSLIEYELKQQGGLRIKRIKDSINTATVNIREYEYGSPYMVGDNPNILFSKDINSYQYICVGPHPKSELNCPYTATYSDPISSLTDSYFGDKVERYLLVKEYYGTNGINGKTEYIYTAPNLILQPGMIGQDEFLTEKNVFKKTGGSFQLINKEIKKYKVLDITGTDLFSNSIYTREQRIWGLDFDKDRDAFETSATECGGYAGSLCYPNRFFQVSFRLVSSPILLSADTSIIYSNDTLLTSKRYIYNIDNCLNPSRIYSNDSRGNIKLEKFQYPLDFPAITASDTLSAGIQNLISKHVISEPIEKSIFLQNSDSSNKRLISSIFTSFRPDVPVPYKLYSILISDPITNFSAATITGGALVKDSRYIPRVMFSNYDSKGNLLEQEKTNDVKQSYIWDYMGQFPSAQVNAAGSEMAYTSFEADGKGNWFYSGSISSDNSSPTGNKCYNLSGGNISKSSLISGIYVISYWSKSGSTYSVNGSTTPSRTGKTIDGWTYFEHEISGTSITIVGSNYIDEVRLFPKGCQMTTYSYDPLIGMTSQCDADNRITYYEYDLFGRLRRVKDQDKYIIKAFDYGFMQPQNQ